VAKTDSTKTKGNNGLGNGEDGAPPGTPPKDNDGEGTSPGDPGSKPTASKGGEINIKPGETLTVPALPPNIVQLSPAERQSMMKTFLAASTVVKNPQLASSFSTPGARAALQTSPPKQDAAKAEGETLPLMPPPALPTIPVPTQSVAILDPTVRTTTGTVQIVVRPTN
jgi:hypothetical protein